MATYSIGRRRIIALLVLSSILLITLDVRGSAAIDRLRSAFSVVLSPFDSAARAISHPVVNAWYGITHYEDLQHENEALRARIDLQRGVEIEARASILEFQELLLLNRLLSASSYPTATAQVQGEAPSNFQYTVEIDKGSNDGIAVGMPVINGAGLVGKITRVFPSSSIVLLITDPEFSIGAKVLTAAGTVEPPTRPIRPTEQSIPDGGTTTTSPTSTTSPPATSTTTTDPATSTTTTDPATTTTMVEVIRETGTLSGQGPGRPLLFRFVADSSTEGQLQPGSTVQTAGGNISIAPPGIPIGTVSRVSSQSGSSVPLVEVESSAGDLTKLNFVAVLLYLPNTSGT